MFTYLGLKKPTRHYKNIEYKTIKTDKVCYWHNGNVLEITYFLTN